MLNKVDVLYMHTALPYHASELVESTSKILLKYLIASRLSPPFLAVLANTSHVSIEPDNVCDFLSIASLTEITVSQYIQVTLFLFSGRCSSPPQFGHFPAFNSII